MFSQNLIFLHKNKKTITLILYLELYGVNSNVAWLVFFFHSHSGFINLLNFSHICVLFLFMYTILSKVYLSIFFKVFISQKRLFKVKF